MSVCIAKPLASSAIATVLQQIPTIVDQSNRINKLVNSRIVESSYNGPRNNGKPRYYGKIP